MDLLMSCAHQKLLTTKFFLTIPRKTDTIFGTFGLHQSIKPFAGAWVMEVSSYGQIPIKRS